MTSRKRPPARPARAQRYSAPPPGRAGRGRPRSVSARIAEANRRRRLRRGLTAGVAVLLAAVIGVVIAVRVQQAHFSYASASTQARPAPDGVFQTASGKTVTVASLRGHRTLLWFVVTICPSCEAGTQAIAQNLAALKQRGIRVVEVEAYKNLGYNGPSPESFGRTYGGRASSDPDWTFGTASASLTSSYDPQGYADIYYLLSSQGQITYVNGSPASTMPALLSH